MNLSCVCPPAGLLREGHRHLDGRVLALCLLGAARIRGRQLCVEATQGASAIQTAKEQEQGKERVKEQMAARIAPRSVQIPLTRGASSVSPSLERLSPCGGVLLLQTDGPSRFKRRDAMKCTRQRRELCSASDSACLTFFWNRLAVLHDERSMSVT